MNFRVTAQGITGQFLSDRSGRTEVRLLSPGIAGYEEVAAEMLRRAAWYGLDFPQGRILRETLDLDQWGDYEPWGDKERAFGTILDSGGGILTSGIQISLGPNRGTIWIYGPTVGAAIEAAMAAAGCEKTPYVPCSTMGTVAACLLQSPC